MPAMSSTALLITFRLLSLSPAIRVMSSVVNVGKTARSLATFKELYTAFIKRIASSASLTCMINSPIEPFNSELLLDNRIFLSRLSISFNCLGGLGALGGFGAFALAATASLGSIAMSGRGAASNLFVTIIKSWRADLCFSSILNN